MQTKEQRKKETQPLQTLERPKTTIKSQEAEIDWECLYCMLQPPTGHYADYIAGKRELL